MKLSNYLVDSNVILDLFFNDPIWADWSVSALTSAAADGNLYINPVIYTEISIGIERIEILNEAIEETGIIFTEIPREALFLTGKVFMMYKKNGGKKNSPLPDFYIGAHAAVSKMKLITRDLSRYGTYYPTIELITP